MMRRSHGPLQLVMRSGLLLLLLLLNGVLAQVQDDKEQQGLQDFHSNFGGPPLGENGFVGENPLPRPQGVVDLGNFGDHFFSRDIFQEVDQTFNSNNQLTHESGTFQPSIPRAELSNDISSFSTSSSDLRVSSVADTDDFHESSAFQVFHDRVPGTESSSDPGPVSTIPEDVLTINFEENQQPFQGFRGNQRPGRPGRGPNRPPSSRHPSRPLRRPIRQPGFNGRPGGPNSQGPRNGRPGGPNSQGPFNGRPGGPNRQRTGEPSFISLLIG